MSQSILVRRACRPTGLTQLGYHYTHIPCNGDESMSMPSLPMGLTQMGYLPYGFFDKPLRRSSHMDDNETQAKDDIDDDTNDMQVPESNDPSGQVVGKSEIQTIDM